MTNEDKIKFLTEALKQAKAQVDKLMQEQKRLLLNKHPIKLMTASELLEAAELEQRKEWVGLTDDDVYLLETLYAPPIHPDFVGGDDWGEFIRSIEDKLKEKNT